MKLYFRYGKVSYPIKKDNIDIIFFIKDKIKNNEKIHMEELEEFLDTEHIDNVLLDINHIYDIFSLDTKYHVHSYMPSPYYDDERYYVLTILPEKYLGDDTKVPYTLCYLSEEEFEVSK